MAEARQLYLRLLAGDMDLGSGPEPRVIIERAREVLSTDAANQLASHLDGLGVARDAIRAIAAGKKVDALDQNEREALEAKLGEFEAQIGALREFFSLQRVHETRVRPATARCGQGAR
jgi:hypothetical protein